MPPEIASIPLPTSWGQDAADWLESQGLVAHVPTLRASDFELCLHDPFSYYLHRRLGLHPRLRYSKALTCGSWFHERLRIGWLDNTGITVEMNESLEARFEELSVSCAELGIGTEARDAILEREERDMWMACAWFDAMLHVKFGDPARSLHERLSDPWWRVLGQEVRGVLPRPDHLPPLVCQFDMLLYHAEQNALYIGDPKTCGGPTTPRLQICPLEFPTSHYMYIAKCLLEQGVFADKYAIPTDCTLGGMMHFAVQKPTIEFGTNDRDCHEHEHILKSGPNKGDTTIRREYSGAPRYENYVTRCEDWYFARNRYEDLAPDRRDNPVVNISTTSGNLFDDANYLERYVSRLALVDRYATMAPHPSSFPMSATNTLDYGGNRLKPMAPFRFNHPRVWPELVQELRLMITWRDEDLNITNEPMLTGPFHDLD